MQALRGLSARGVTTIHVMGARPELQTILEELDASGRLRARCRLYLAWPSPATAAWLGRKAKARRPIRRASSPLLGTQQQSLRGTESRLVDALGVKVWLDGTLGSRSASLSQPYSDAPTLAVPQPLMSVAALRALIIRADKAGVQVAVHVIGDAALDRLLNALKPMQRPADAWPVRIEHAQIVRPDQLARLAKRRDVLCSIQPLHRKADAPWSGARLGAARVSWGYRAASLNRACPLIAGSDAPVVEPAPWKAMRALMQHDRADERLAAAVAFAAHARHLKSREARTVSVGAAADLVLWSARPVPGASKLPSVRMIILGGALMQP